MKEKQPFLNWEGDSVLQQLQTSLLGGDPLTGVATLLTSTNIPQMNKPMMMPDVENGVLDAISQFQNKNQWKQWGLNSLREQGAAVLLAGSPGNGKTVIAKWMASRIRRGFKMLSATDLGGGGAPGDAERAVESFFEYCKGQGNITIFMDECDHLLLDRGMVTETTWQIGTTEALMVQMSEYPGLIICATNYEKNLDKALEQRFLSIIRVPRPDFEHRLILWEMKLPKSFPFRPTDREMRKLANYDLNGRQIENVIINVASRCIRRKIKPTMGMFVSFCVSEGKKHIEKEDADD